MRFFVSAFKWTMLVSGLLTCTMFVGLVSPGYSLASNFGETTAIPSPALEIIIRNWSALIGLVGIMLIYGALVPNVRRFALIIAGTSKIIFIALILTYGRQYMTANAGTAVIADSFMVLVYLVYLLVPDPEQRTGELE